MSIWSSCSLYASIIWIMSFQLSVVWQETYWNKLLKCLIKYLQILHLSRWNIWFEYNFLHNCIPVYICSDILLICYFLILHSLMLLMLLLLHFSLSGHLSLSTLKVYALSSCIHRTWYLSIILNIIFFHWTCLYQVFGGLSESSNVLKIRIKKRMKNQIVNQIKFNFIRRQQHSDSVDVTNTLYAILMLAKTGVPLLDITFQFHLLLRIFNI